MNRAIPTGLVVLAFLLFSAASFNSLWAQAVANAQISGVVTDPSGAPIASAKVTVTQTATGLSRTTQTGADGSYVLPELPVGPYQMEVQASGFGTYLQTGINLQVSESPKINVSLRLGQITEQVEVTANASMVKTDTTAVSQVY